MRNARLSSVAPLGGVNIVVPSTEAAPLALADREITRRASLHANVVRAELPWSALEPSGPDQIDPHALAFTDRLVATRRRAESG